MAVIGKIQVRGMRAAIWYLRTVVVIARCLRLKLDRDRQVDRALRWFVRTKVS